MKNANHENYLTWVGFNWKDLNDILKEKKNSSSRCSKTEKYKMLYNSFHKYNMKRTTISSIIVLTRETDTFHLRKYRCTNTE